MRQNKEQKTENKNPFYGQELKADYHISRPKWNKEGTACRFSLDLPAGISFYGLTLRYDKDGVPFICASSYKGSDGNWYNNYYVKFADAMLQKIVKELEAV